jgi:hypothetical protein
MTKDNYNKSNYRRPILLSILAVLMVLGGIMISILGVFLMAVGLTPAMIDFLAEMDLTVEIGLLAGAFVLLLGIIYIFIGMALFSGKKWGWWLATIMTVIVLISNLYVFSIPSLILNLIVLLYLLTKNTRGWFGV